MIRVEYEEKGAGLHDAIASAGHMLLQIDGDWWADSPKVQSIIREYDPETILNEVVLNIKAHSRTLIYGFFSQEKQNNLQARALELLEKKFEGGLSGDEFCELENIKKVRAYIKSVRDFSDELERAAASIADERDFRRLLQFDVVGAEWPRWIDG